MDAALHRRLQILCSWCGIGYLLFVFGSLAIMGFLPWPSPNLPVDQVAEIYRDNSVVIRIGAVGMMFAALLFLPFAGAIAHHVRTFEGDRSWLLTPIFVMATFANAMLTFYPALWWITATFRPDRGTEILHVLNDTAWLQFFGGYSLALPMFWVPAIMILNNKKADQAFPRWVGYFNILASIGFLPDQMLFFFDHGPFSWNGIIAVWIPLLLFFLWFIIMAYFTHRHAVRMPIV